jgi:HAD superfamily hydrolase (TIGR01549 family)
MKFHYYLFDLDNSLLYIPEPPHYFDRILVETIIKFSNKEVPLKEERNKFWSSGDKYTELLENWGVEVNEWELFWKYFDEIDFKKRKVLIAENKISLFSDVLEVLKTLKNAQKKLAIVSNTARYIVNYVIQNFKLKDYFHNIFGLGYGKEQELAKPSPAGIRLSLNNLGYNPKNSSAIMIGDSMVDIIAAKRADIHACFLNRNLWEFQDKYEQWEYQPDFIIENLEELLTL